MQLTDEWVFLYVGRKQAGFLLSIFGVCIRMKTVRDNNIIRVCSFLVESIFWLLVVGRVWKEE